MPIKSNCILNNLNLQFNKQSKKDFVELEVKKVLYRVSGIQVEEMYPIYQPHHFFGLGLYIFAAVVDV